MAFIGAFSLSFFFFFLAHSTLLHYLVEDARGAAMSAERILVPKPTQGKGVAALAFLAGLMCAAVALIVYPKTPMEWGDPGRALRVVFVFVIFPLLFYSFYIARRLTRKHPSNMGALMFVSKRATAAELLVPVVVAILLNLVSRLA